MDATVSAERGKEAKERRSVRERIRTSAAARTLIGVALVVVPSVAALVALEQFYTTFFGPDWPYARVGTIVAPVILALVVFGSYVLYSRLVDSSWPNDLRRENAGRDVLVGTLLGSGLFTAALAVIWAAGGYSVVSVNSISIVLPAVTGVLFFVSLEEVVNRGIVLPEIESRLGSWAAILVSSLFFAGYHTILTANPTAIAIGVIFLAGLLMGAAYVYTRQLWFPIAIHAGWNFTQGALFGVSVSGNDVESVAFLVGETTGPNWLSGGAYGLEGSLITLAVLSLGTILVLWRVKKHGKALPRTWPEP
ncbi:lysostaphin resistance A-like protein [Haloferax sp. YSSS75]|uniref:CPBP family intramembrane glutamic endopeptidase n=1 Tax=Haloferax sp. YSSS75 TaxID=3388564 RepID=UPI00398D0E0C